MEPLLFLDCEFTSLEAPELLSLALVPLDGHAESLYLELSIESEAFLARKASANTFVRKQVLPQLGQSYFSQVHPSSDAQLGARLASWVCRRLPAEGELHIAYDYHADFDLLERVLRTAGKWEQLERLLTPVHVAYLWADPDACAAAHQSWHLATTDDAQPQLRQHHALADARALRQAYLAVHG